MPYLLERSSARERLRIVCAFGFWAATYLLFLTWNQLQDEYPSSIWQTRRLVATLLGALLFFGFTRLADRIAHRSFKDRARMLGAAAIGCCVVMILGRALTDFVAASSLGRAPVPLERHVRFTMVWAGYFAGGALAFLSFAPGAAMRSAAAAEPPAPEAPPETANDSSWPDALWVSRGRETVRVPVETIEWIEAEGDYVRLHASAGGGLLRATLSSLEIKLDPSVFTRVHRSAICRRSAIVAMMRKPTGAMAVRLEAGAEVPVGRSYRESVDELLAPAREAQSRASA
ncbi:LytTR family DNA-binding domain-containing protein [Sphingomonas sp.]|uniref:LytR/AlgR family response regulator transcription factor n=1 Tax=Sphingomonas sp. TaxID=28214 RepID=UPI002DB903F5|nr:LytTR family DNA-binding domain-containing protein [Sphingomonas sp.]HEU4968215.1 LytTR family DNA-binding domain-containing protein [Sphingomonas sp.]